MIESHVLEKMILNNFSYLVIFALIFHIFYFKKHKFKLPFYPSTNLLLDDEADVLVHDVPDAGSDPCYVL